MRVTAVARFAEPFRPLSAALLLLLAGASPAFAHHPFEGVEASQLAPVQGLISGLGHPVLGPDHLLFLVALAFLGLKRPMRWVLPLLAVGLGGSLVSQLLPLAPSVSAIAEVGVALSLAVEGLIGLGVLPAALLVPLIALHGYLLGSMVVGAEATPLLAYGAGLLISQGAVLLFATAASRQLSSWIGSQGRRIAALAWIGIGAALAFSALTA